MTFSPGADVYFNVPEMTCNPNPDWKSSNRNYVENKTGGIMWMVGNCGFTGGREIYVREMQKHIPVDIYGHCGTLGIVCGDYSKLNSSCVNALMSTYKFYLSFENSFCNGYFTEKITKTVDLDIIPVVMGLNNYTALLSPGTFIDVRDFASPKHLADHLHYLSQNDTAYNQMIEKKKKVKCQVANHSRLCNLCKHLHTHKNNIEMITDLRKTWNDQVQCLSPHQFFKGIADSILPNLTDYRTFKEGFWNDTRKV